MNVLHLSLHSPPAHLLLPKYLQERCLRSLQEGARRRLSCGREDWLVRREKISPPPMLR